MRSLRLVSRFLSSPSQPNVSGGFRYPDARAYELQCNDGGFHLAVRFEGSCLHEEFTLVHPSIEDSREFLAAYGNA